MTGRKTRDRELDELAKHVAARLYHEGSADHVEQWRHEWWAAQPPATPEEIAERQKRDDLRRAKQLARDGDLEALCDFLVRSHDDPELADFVAVPPRPKHARADYARARPFKEYGKDERHDTVQRIRKILQEETDRIRIDGLVIEVASRILKCAPEEIAELIKRGKGRSHRRRALATL